MIQIKEYVLLLVGSCLICGGLTILAPNGQFERIIRLIGSVFMLLCLLSPVANTWSFIHNNYQEFFAEPSMYSDQQSWDYAANTMSQALQNEINSYVLSVTGSPADDITIDMNAENKDFSVNQILIVLDDKDMLKASAVADYVAIKIGIRPQVISNEKGE